MKVIFKVIFLDFDGVLNSVHFSPISNAVMGSKEWLAAQLQPELVERVQWIVEQTGAVICLSTSWRHAHTNRALAEMLRWVGLTAPIVGQTPDGAFHIGTEAVPRDKEIAAWVEWTGVTDFVVLDDIEMHHPLIAPHSVLTCDGITQEDAQRAVGILNGNLTPTA